MRAAKRDRPRPCGKHGAGAEAADAVAGNRCNDPSSSPRRSKTGLDRSLSQFHAESGGIFETHVFRLDMAARLFAEALAGDRHALIFDTCVQSFLCGSHLCITCDETCAPPAAFCFAVPRNDAACSGLLMGVCGNCAALSDAELHEVFVAWLRRVWPNLRVLDPARFAEGGRA